MRFAILTLAFLCSCSSSASRPDATTTAGDASVEREAAVADAAPLDADLGDATVTDQGPVDTGLPPSPCGNAGATCRAHADCITPQPAPASCATCTPRTTLPCIAGQCVSTPILEAGDVYSVAFSLNANVIGVSSMVWFALAVETPAGRTIACPDVYAGRVDINDACYNVLDVRFRDITQPGDTFTVTLGAFPSARRVLVIARGYDDQRGQGALLGVSCTDLLVGAAGSGPITAEGGVMTRP